MVSDEDELVQMPGFLVRHGIGTKDYSLVLEVSVYIVRRSYRPRNIGRRDARNVRGG